MTAIIWVHADCLHPRSPAFAAFPGAPAVFVWDDDELRRTGWTLKRIGFVYECLLDLPVTIRRGDPVAEVRRFAEEHGASSIVTMATPDPHLQAQTLALNAQILPVEPFADIKGPVDLGRFSRYWRKAESALLW